MILIVCAKGDAIQDANPLHVRVDFDRTNGWPLFSIPDRTDANLVYELQSSTTLTDWRTEGVFLSALAPYPELSSSNFGARFYRVIESPKRTTNEWSNQAVSVWPRSKFIISMTEPHRVYFHDRQIFHYQFARQHLPSLPSETPESFDEAVLFPSRQQAVIGGFYLGSATGTGIGIEFVSAEPLEPSRLVELFKTVATRVSIQGRELFLVPTMVQRSSIMANLEYFRSNGVEIRDITELPFSNLVHSEGWTVGTLRYVPASELDAAIAAGLITPESVLVTDATPRDLPPIAGLISLAPSSPNSHTALRLQSAGLPFVDLPISSAAEVTNLTGRRVVVAAVKTPPISTSSWQPHYPPSWQKPLRLIELSTLSESLQTAVLGMITNTAVSVQGMERFGSYSTSTDALSPEDTRHFGSKAANYGILRRAIPNQSPPAIAFSFDLWLDFMGQTLSGGRTLKEEIDERLELIAENPSVAGVKLKEIRDLIEDTTQFTADQQAAITNALAVFDPNRKIRFRSSSNAEDLPRFSAAGLYESYSGCLLDDLISTPGDICRCDPLDDKRRSVFRAIRKVFASFYNEQALLERKHFGINEEEVGMAILVHHSFPDEIELANGIANVDFEDLGEFGGIRMRTFSIVSQRGAVSVANPEGGELPERYDGQIEFGSIVSASLSMMSTIRPPQTPVLNYRDEYDQLLELFAEIAGGYPWASVPGVTRLNFEFKKTADGLSIKQVRPVFINSGHVDTIVLPEKVKLETFQGGETPADLESSHELKSVWEFESEGWIPRETSANAPLFETARVVYISDGRVTTNALDLVNAEFVDAPEIFFYAQYLWSGLGARIGLVTNQFVAVPSGEVFNLGINFSLTLPASSPFIYPSDLILYLSRPGNSGVAELIVGDAPSRGDQVASFSTNGVTVETRYSRVITPAHALVGFGPTENLGEWKETIIAGLTSEPIVLRGYFSQTYNPSRHNFSEQFLFEPALEEGIPEEILDELRSANIWRVQLNHNFLVFDISDPLGSRIASDIELIGFDGSRRPVPER